MGLQEQDLIMAAKKVSGKTVKNPSSRACWTKRLGQVSKYHLKVQKKNNEFEKFRRSGTLKELKKR